MSLPELLTGSKKITLSKMKTTRTYPKLYYACKGDGWIPTTGTSSDTAKQCPVCNGTGIITVTEIIEE